MKLDKIEKKIVVLIVVIFVVTMIGTAIAGHLTKLQREQLAMDNDPMVAVTTGSRSTCVDCGKEISNHWVWHRIPRSQEKFLPAPRDEGRKLCPDCKMKHKDPQLPAGI